MMTSITGLSINALNISKKKSYEYDNVIMTYSMKTIAYSFCGMMNRPEFIKYASLMLLL